MSYQRSMRWRLVSGRLVGAAVLVVCLSAATGDAPAGAIMQPTDEQTPPEAVPPLHREVPDDPYIAVPPDHRRTAPAFRAARNGFTSVQVNVDESGLNILSAQEETAEEFGEPITFLWVIARKPAQERKNEEGP